MKYVRQEHRTGCGYATMAMLTDQSYSDVLDDFYGERRRTSRRFPRLIHGAELARYVEAHGWLAIKRLPLAAAITAPFERHAVLVSHVLGLHWVALDRSGRLYDPVDALARTLTESGDRVCRVIGFDKVAA